MGVSTSTTSEAVRRLSDQGYIVHAPYSAIELTRQGELAAIGMVRRHRLLETFLVEHLGYTWDEVHDDAEVLEHAVTERFMERLDSLLGHPTRDPHGDPIPRADGGIDPQHDQPLAEMSPGQRGVIVRISDENPEMLRYFTAEGIEPGLAIALERVREFDGLFMVRFGEQDSLTSMGEATAAAIWVHLT